MLSIAAQIIDEQVAARLLADGLRKFHRDQSGFIADAGQSAQMQSDISVVEALVRDFSLLNGFSPSKEWHCDAAAADFDSRTWLASLPCRRVLIQGWLQPSSGVMLDHLMTTGADAEFVDASLGALLRHVEIKRESALETDGVVRNSEPCWIERHGVAILFSRYARRTGDIRFLNGALKLNDWAYGSHRRFRASVRYCRFLLSVAEQEATMKALLS
jgi:hypothetical protein